MIHHSLALSLALALTLPACGARLVAEGSEGTVSVGAQPDPNALAAPAPVGTEVVVAQITRLRVHASGQAAETQAITGGAVAIELPGGIAVSNIVGGDLEIDASAVEGAPCTVTAGTVTLASGATFRIGGGHVTLARGGSGWIVSSGRISTAEATASTTASTAATASTITSTSASAAPGATAALARTTSTSARTANGAQAFGRVTGVSVDRVTADGGNQVIAGGAITVTGAPVVNGLAVVDGAIDFDDADVRTTATGRASRVSVRATDRRVLRVRAGGTIVVSDRHGRRWRARVEGGEIQARTEGSNPEGHVVWQPTGGELRVTVLASGGDTLTIDSPVLPEASVELTPRVRAALDSLVAAAPSGSTEASRLQSAVEVVVRNAESADPSFYAIPVRGRSLVLLVDVSYSMSDPDPQGAWFAATPSKLDVARAELVKVLASIPAGVAVNVVAFSSRVQTMWTASRTMDDAGLAEAVRWVAALRPADETHPLEAMEAAAALGPDQIVMLSDGRPSDSDAVLRSLLQRVDAIAAHTRVDVVGFGADQDRAFLTSLAAHGHGTLRLR